MKRRKTITANNQITIYVSEEKGWLLSWAKNEYGRNLSRMFTEYLNKLWESNKTSGKLKFINDSSPEDEKKTQPVHPQNAMQIKESVESCVKTAFADITNDRTFIADIGRAFAANATRLRYNELKIRHPGCDAQIRAAITKDHAELARLAGLDK